jgi:hypothetical protein
VNKVMKMILNVNKNYVINPVICVHIRFAEDDVDVNDPLSFYKPDDSDALRILVMNTDVLITETENGVIESPMGNVEESVVHERMQNLLQIEKC